MELGRTKGYPAALVKMAEAADQVEVIGDIAVMRLTSDLRGALRRRPTQEPRLAGALRVLSAHSNRLRGELCDAVDTMVRRGSFERPL
jgi:hypothetical protein